MKAVRKAYRVICRKSFLNLECVTDRQEANTIISNTLRKGEPAMIARYGTTELNLVNNYVSVHSNVSLTKQLASYVVDNTHLPWWETEHFQYLKKYSGIFPVNMDTINRLCEIFLEDSKLIDVLGSHQYYEKFMPLNDRIQLLQLEVMYPFGVSKPWTSELKGKRVLVIHPFEDTIIEQYKKRDLLFQNQDILPDFELLTLKAVQTVGDATSEFKDWFAALDYMKKQMEEIDFDICLIGCGAYGLPLAAHSKRLGKVGIHLGGGLQLLFGILGKRWVEQYPEITPWVYNNVPIDIDYRYLFNEHWEYPLDSDKPKGADKVENACYWK